VQVIFATHNAHKVSEIRPLLPVSVKLVSLDDLGFSREIPETQDTLAGNALQKAKFVYEHFKCACFADDTGLEVDALDGTPGVYSARYAGENKVAEDNIRKLLKEMDHEKERSATFKTVIAYINGGKEYLFEGFVKGRIAEERMGEKGFGYDPVFIPEGHSRSFAQMTLEEKNNLSHRSMAVRKFAEFLSK
jgi:XTP/dITP diphosphohydrolase